VELHIVNKEKPTEKLMGRKRKAAKEEGKEHYPITARGLWDPLSAWKLDGILGGDEAVRPRLGAMHERRRKKRSVMEAAEGTSW
jgi:hypothetical protein